MVKKQNKTKLTKLLIAIVIIICAGLIFAVYSKKSNNTSQQLNTSPMEESQFKSYTSENLKISFNYPKDWYIDDRYYIVMLTNYQTSLNKNDYPSPNQIRIIIREGLACDVSLDEQVRIGGCFAEGNWVPTKILEKKIKNLSSGIFYTYVIKHPSGTQQMRYFLQRGDRILQISKNPDNSQFEREFERIIDSIKF